MRFKQWLFVAALVLVLPGLASAATARLTWTDNSDNETTFEVERVVWTSTDCVGAQGFARIGATGGNVASFTDQNAVQGTVYCYRVRAGNTAGFSEYSNVAGFQVPLAIPAAPTNLRFGQLVSGVSGSARIAQVAEELDEGDE